MNDQIARFRNVAPRKEFPNSRPRDAATLIIVDTKDGEPRVLMGRRHDTHKFMPGKYVFPGGRVHASDHSAPSCDELHPDVEAKLMVDMKGRPSPRRARALALAAIRETCEEAGLLIGARQSPVALTRVADVWQPFCDQCVMPRLSELKFIARAITPPRRARRYDTRFFCTTAQAIAGKTDQDDGELGGLHWLSLAQTEALDLPLITRVVLEDLFRGLAKGGMEHLPSEVPYYFMRHGRFERRLI